MSDPADQTEAMGGAQITQHLRGSGELVLGGRYELTERIASGGMASVWRAYDDVLARTVAVKLLHDHLAADGGFRERFRREAIAAAKLTHPNVVSLYDTGTDAGRVYLVMEFVDGATLREVMSDIGQLSPGQAAAIGERVARALDYAHDRGLVHRDVKPANVLIGDDGAVKVADFGIAKAEGHDGDLTRTGMVLGTAAYVAPEQITGGETVDGRADQYALGCVLYEALAGRQPFKGDSAVATAAQRLESNPPPLRSVRPDVPRGLDAIVARAMARTPEDRFVSAGALADALAAFADQDSSHTAALPLATSHRATAHAQPAAPRRAVQPAPATPAGERPESFLRTEGRWLLGVVLLILLGAGLLGGALATGALDPQQIPGVGADEPAGGGGADQARDAAPLDVEAGGSLDPQGDGAEKDELVAQAVDGDADTAWRTDTYYNDPAFGGLKEGVGFYVDLGRAQEIVAVQVQFATDATNAELYVADEPADDLDGWERIGEVSEAQGRARVDLDQPATGRFVLVWITAPLPSGGGGFRAEVAEVAVLGPAQGSDS